MIYSDDNVQRVICDNDQVPSCFQANIGFHDNDICNIKCVGAFSCVDSIIRMTNCNSAHVICNGSNACSNVYVEVEATEFNIECGTRSSCNSIHVNITGQNNAGNVSCIDVRSCDEAEIFVEPRNYQNVRLKMMSYSENVRFSNGFGYEDTNQTAKYVDCNTNTKYIQYNNTALTDPEVEELILNEYENGLFPCDGVTILCYQQNDTTQSSYCDLKFTAHSLNVDSLDRMAPCYWVQVDTAMDISCVGVCDASPTYDPTAAPTSSPTELTTAPTTDPTNDPTIEPTHDPTMEPTLDPTVDPTQNPTDEPTHDPTRDPTFHPTVEPTLDPSNAPTFTPSAAPTSVPSFPPTNAPTISPTLAPSFSPSIAPSSPPTVAPSNAPSFTPTNDPTFSPSVSPTRVPTGSNRHKWWIEIDYQINNYSFSNIQFIINDSASCAEDIQEIIEQNYFDLNLIQYRDFAVYIETINHASPDDVELDDLYSYQLATPITLSSMIWTLTDNIGSIIVEKSKSDAFTTMVQDDLEEYFDKNGIIFTVSNADELQVLNQPKQATEAPDWTAAIVSIIIVFIGLVIGLSAFIFNKRPKSKVDNAMFLAPILVSFQIYDLFSDLYLSYEILSTPNVTQSDISFWCGVSSLTFTVLPFLSNVYYAISIPSQKVVRNNAAASAYFKTRLAEFVVITVFTGGCFPALTLVSSRIFALDMFNSGLSSYELNKLSKIKVRSTITLENGPQLITQIIYSSVTGNISTALVLAFAASSLSVIATLATYYAQTNAMKSDDNEVVQYSIFFRLKEGNQVLSEDEKQLINHRKERKNELTRAICGQFRIPFQSMEIGFIKITSNGCDISIVHHIFTEQLQSFDTKKGYKMQIEPSYYTQQLFRSHSDALSDIICNHVRLNNPKRFMVTYSDNSSNSAIALLEGHFSLTQGQLRNPDTLRSAAVQSVDSDRDSDDDDAKYTVMPREHQTSGEEIEMIALSSNVHAHATSGAKNTTENHDLVQQIKSMQTMLNGLDKKVETLQVNSVSILTDLVKKVDDLQLKQNKPP